MHIKSLQTDLDLQKEAERHASQQLTTDFKRVVEDAEILLQATAHLSDEKLSGIRLKMEESLRLVKERIDDAHTSLPTKSKAMAKALDA